MKLTLALAAALAAAVPFAQAIPAPPLKGPGPFVNNTVSLPPLNHGPLKPNTTSTVPTPRNPHPVSLLGTGVVTTALPVTTGYQFKVVVPSHGPRLPIPPHSDSDLIHAEREKRGGPGPGWVLPHCENLDEKMKEEEDTKQKRRGPIKPPYQETTASPAPAPTPTPTVTVVPMPKPTTGTICYGGHFEGQPEPWYIPV